MTTELYNFAFYGNWRANVLMSTARGNRKATTEAAIRLYEEFGRLTPWVVWCDGPFQVAAMHAIMPKVLASEQWETMSRYFKHNIFPEHDWNELWEKLYVSVVEPQVVAARQTIRAPYVEARMFDLLKESLFREFDRRLRAEARQTDEVRQTLRRELRNTAGYQHLGLKITSAILQRVNKYGLWIQSNGLVYRTDALDIADEQASHFITNRQCNALNTVQREAMRLYGGVCADADAMVMFGGWSVNILERYCLHRTAGCSYDEELANIMDAIAAIADNSHGVLCTEALVFACDRPTEIRIDDRRRPHNMQGPAITFADGFKAFAVEGVAIDREIVEHPEKITAEQINNARNTEVRRVIMQIYGPERFLKDGHATLVSEDECGELYEVAIPAMLNGQRGEPLVFVRVKNSTPEPDGTYKYYILRVPPRCRTAREAVAWTFGLREHDYSPARET